MDEDRISQAFDAIHDEAIKLLSFDLPEEANDIVHLIIALARYKHDVRTEEEIQRGTTSE